MTAIIENQLNSCKETFLEYVIVEELCYHRNGMKLETLTFSDSYRQENKIVNFSDHDHDEHDFCIIENDSECSHRRSLSTPTGCFKIESLFEVQYEQLKNMKKIGFGSQSDVFSAFYKNRHVAVKVMKNHYENEINNLRKLKHENIVSFIGACTEMNKTFIVMEYCKKGRLYDYLHEPDEPITPRIVLEWSFQIASGMAYLHGHNIIHRDLKSPNILINEDYTLKISDFGLSTPKLTGSAKMPFLGTAFWMAPEVIRREACSETVDVWSYGVILWELFTLQIPYEHFEQTSIIFGIGSNILSLPLPATFPKSFRELIKECWNITPQSRPSFKIILKCIQNNGKELVKITLKKYASLQHEWKNECEGFRFFSRKDLSASQTLFPKIKSLLSAMFKKFFHN